MIRFGKTLKADPSQGGAWLERRMKFLISIFLLSGLAVRAGALGVGVGQSPSQATQMLQSDGILKTIGNAAVRLEGQRLVVTRKDARLPMVMDFARCQGVGVTWDREQWWVLPIDQAGAQIDANRALWVLPGDAGSPENAWHVELQGGMLHAEKTGGGLTVTVEAESATLTKAEARPHSDEFGHRFALEFDGGPALEEALAGFYWGTMLPSVVERTMAAHFPYSDGYVLSTLNVQSYAGSYPAVDHEFQIKGRLAMGSDADVDVVRRMIELQFKLMKDDPEGLWRAPTSVQPNGTREYHVRRNSEDRRENAAMFPLTGDIEVVEEAWHYYEARKDLGWLRAHIENLEHAADWILANSDQYGRVWSDVYYEDQVMKDGRETEAQAFAARAFELLAGMERLLGRRAKAEEFAGAGKKMANVLTAPLPLGYWDEKNERFIDWVDRNGKVHDHLHLLANELPVTFGYATKSQAAAVRKLIDANQGEFERFPSFLAAKVENYDQSEIGDGGPYDLCAAGRYWYWDAAYRETNAQGGMLQDQLKTVAAEGAKHGYFMDERYDMDHVYYIDGKDSHGAQKYYEYPNTFAAVLITKYLGLTIPADADLRVAPQLKSEGSVEFATPAYAVRYSYNGNRFVLKNLADKPRRVRVDLSGLGAGAGQFALESKRQGDRLGGQWTLTLAAGEEARWTKE